MFRLAIAQLLWSGVMVDMISWLCKHSLAVRECYNISSHLCTTILGGFFQCILTITPSETHNFGSKKIWLTSHNDSLHVHIVFVVVGWGWCSLNFKRNIVDTLCHASCRSGTTRPNKAGFLLYEGKGRTVKTLQSINFRQSTSMNV